MSWQNKFKDHTTNVAFHLTLSRNMVRALEIAHAYHHCKQQEAYYISQDFGRTVPSMKCLISRGLIEHHDIDGRLQTTPEQLEAYYKHRWYTLTPAGEAVYQLCVLAGLIIRPQQASNKAAA